MSTDYHRHCQITVLPANGTNQQNGDTWDIIDKLELPNLPSNWKDDFKKNTVNITQDLASILKLINDRVIQPPSNIAIPDFANRQNISQQIFKRNGVAQITGTSLGVNQDATTTYIDQLPTINYDNWEAPADGFIWTEFSTQIRNSATTYRANYLLYVGDFATIHWDTDSRYQFLPTCDFKHCMVGVGDVVHISGCQKNAYLANVDRIWFVPIKSRN